MTSGEEECLTVTIIDDDLVEANETFSVFLMTMNSTMNSVMDITRSSATVIITDDDIVTIGWSAQSYEFEEDGGSTATFCAQIVNGQITRPVTVLYSTIDDTAQSNAKRFTVHALI